MRPGCGCVCMHMLTKQVDCNLRASAQSTLRRALSNNTSGHQDKDVLGAYGANQWDTTGASVEEHRYPYSL